MAEKTYSGKIKNVGAQKVEAVYKTAKHGKSIVKTGKDLRCGK